MCVHGLSFAEKAKGEDSLLRAPGSFRLALASADRIGIHGFDRAGNSLETKLIQSTFNNTHTQVHPLPLSAQIRGRDCLFIGRAEPSVPDRHKM